MKGLRYSIFASNPPKLNANARTEAVIIAIKRGLITLS